MSQVYVASESPRSQREAPPACQVSADVQLAVGEARRIAEMAGRPLASADVLLGMLRVGGAAARLLAERGITPGSVETVLPQAHLEPTSSIDSLLRTTQEIAVGFSSPQVSSLHLLLSLLRESGSAIDVVRLTGNEPTKLRALVMRALSGPGKKHERRASRVGLAVTPAGHLPAQPPQDQPEPRPASPPPIQNHESMASPLGFSPILPPSFPVLFRERELGRLLDILATKTPRMIAVVGESGEGRTTLISALAATESPPPVYPCGDFGNPPTLGALFQAMHAQAPPSSPIVLEGAAWLGTEGSDAPLQLLATAAAGRKWILTLTPADIRRIELGIPSLPENLEIIRLSQPPLAQMLEMIDLGIGTLLQSSSVEFEENLAPLLYRLSPHYPTDRAQPGRSITIAEIAVARAERLEKKRVTRGDLGSVVADASGASLAQLLREDDERFHSLEARLSARVVGHEEPRKKIANVLRRGYAGFRGKRPLASLLLLGPTGVGKTETARAIADALFDGETALLRIDLSEFSESHSIARLIGAPPGYLGHEQGGQLTEALRRRPAQVVLMDEMEKAHRDVQLLLLQVLEDGRLTDGRGRTVDFSSSVIVMTSNLGSECYRHTRDPAEATILALARSRLPSELWNRIDEVLCYAPLSESDLAAIVARIARSSSDRLHTERAIRFHIDASVVAAILRTETDRSLGARPLRRAFERMIEGPIANEIVAGRLRSGVEIKIRCLADDRLDFALLR